MKKEFPGKRLLIIFTGGPGTGKSGTAGRFLDYLNNDEIIRLSFDQIKEANWDRFGFEDQQQKDRLNWWSLEEFYLTIQKRMWENKTILIEYPFFQRHKPELEKLIKKSEYLAATVFLYTDMQTAYDRSLNRDQLENRHPGHLLNSYHQETYRPEMLSSVSRIIPSFEEFSESIAGRDYNIKIDLNISVDVTDFSTISYEQLYHQIVQYQNKNLQHK